MTQLSTRCLKAGLSALHFSGVARATRAIAPFTGGQGALFMLHHVRPRQPQAFDPNRLLSITPEFLEDVVRYVRRAGFDVVSLDDAHLRLTGQDTAKRPFACFTFDDGYRDNRDFALPVLKRHGVPFTVYAAADFADGRGFLWWLVLEQVVRIKSRVSLSIDGAERSFACATTGEKYGTFRFLYWWLRCRSEAEARGIVLALAHKAGIDIHAPCRELVMTWPELREFAADPLVTIGAHSVRHMAIAKLPANEARAEVADSIARVQRELGRPCRHFCYPYGNPESAGEREFALAEELGLLTAVTTRKGFVGAAAGTRLTAMPRVSLNGEYQRVRYIKALMSGLPFGMWNVIGRSGACSGQRSGGRTAVTPGAAGPAVAKAARQGPVYRPAPGSAATAPVPAGDESMRCIQLTSKQAGHTQASPPTT